MSHECRPATFSSSKHLMVRQKQKFLDRKSAQHFHLIHRSQRDPLYNDADASRYVLLPSRAHNEDYASEGSEFEDLPPLISDSETKNWDFDALIGTEFVDEHGIRRDGYDYAQHMKEMGQGEGRFYSSHGVFEPFDALTKRVEIPKEAMPCEKEQERMFEAITLTTDTMDNDIREALVNAEAFETIDDDFMMQANADQMMEEDSGGFDYDAHIASLLAAAAGLERKAPARKTKPDSVENEETKPISNEDKLALDAQFEQLYAEEYGSDSDLTDEEQENLDGVALEGKLLDDIMKDFIVIKQEINDEDGRIGNPLASGNRLSTILAEADPLDEEPEDFDDSETERELCNYLQTNVYLRRPTPPQWDCESIVSTYSNLDNRPTIIQDNTGRRKSKSLCPNRYNTKTSNLTSSLIQLSRKSGLPIDKCRTPPKEHNIQAVGIDPDKAKLLKRSDCESKEDRKIRKAAVKQLQRDRRKLKKEYKHAFKIEEKRILDTGRAANEGAAGHSVSIFRY